MPQRLTLLLLLAAAAAPASAQDATFPSGFVQIGAAGVPGAGVQAGMVLPALAIFTREVMLHGHYRFGAAEDQILLVGLGVGGSIRLLRIVYIIVDQAPGPFEFDAGLRFGPSFAFSFIEQTAATRARQFRLFADPFLRGTMTVGQNRVVFGEIGTQQGWLRVGLVVGL